MDKLKKAQGHTGYITEPCADTVKENKGTGPYIPKGATRKKAANFVVMKVFRRSTFLFVVAMLTVILYVTNVHQDLAQTIHSSYQLLNCNRVKENNSVSGPTCPPAVAAVDTAKLPPLPTLSPNQTSLFKAALTEQEINLLSTALKIFDEIMVNASLQYFIYKGSLLGSYRHHSIIPWDDDIDVQVHSRDKEAMIKAFKNRLSNHSLTRASNRLKFYHNSGRTINKFNYKSPFIDVSFYRDNATHLWDITLPKQKPFLTSWIFPLQDRPFLGHVYPAPRDPLVNLQATYKIDQCYTGSYNHVSESMKPRTNILEIPCSALVDVLPFVKHVRGPGGAWCEEVLTFRGQVLNTFIRKSSGIPVC